METMMSEPATIGDGALRSLIELYKTDPRSGYANLGFSARKNYECNCRKIDSEHGNLAVRNITNDDLINWHKEWVQRGPSSAVKLVMTLRQVMHFGEAVLKDKECERVAVA